MQITTSESKEIWKSPDGTRKIWEISYLNEAGTPIKRKTYSRTISQQGWTGQVEEYEKEGRVGIEVFVRQPVQEGNHYGKAPLPGQTPLPVGAMVDMAELNKSIDRLAELVEQLASVKEGQKQVPEMKDVTPTAEEFEAATELLGGEEVEDDL